jgi:hypothetical protein
MMSHDMPQLWKHITKESIYDSLVIENSNLTVISSLDDI